MERVKVYRLTADGQWDDRGTGRVSVEWMEVCCMRVRIAQLPSLHRELHIQLLMLLPKQTPHCYGFDCCLGSVQQSNTRGLIVISEDQDTRTLLIHEIQSQDIYQRQGGAQQSLCFRHIIPSCNADCQHQAHMVHCMLTRLYACRGDHHHLVRCGDRHRCGAQLSRS